MTTRKTTPSKLPPGPKTVQDFSQLTVLGLDPGSDNFGYCVLRVLGVTRGRMRCKILQHGRILSTVRTLTSPRLLTEQLAQYVDAVTELIKWHEVKAVIAERYMIRPGRGGTSNETVNIMLGALLMLKHPTKIIPASQWKNAASSEGVVLDEIYEQLKPAKVTPHQIDACHIAQYGASHLVKIRPHQYPLGADAIGKVKTTNLGVLNKVKKPRKKRRTVAVKTKVSK